MKDKLIELDFSNVFDINDLHLYMKEKLGFPHFYGKNGHAMIDCLSSLRFPEDEMISITLEKDEMLILDIKSKNGISENIKSFLQEIIAFVNKRELEVGNNESISLQIRQT